MSQTTINNTVADAKERTTALDISRSFCVQAPAGSGKTELLTQRILNLLAHCQQPEEVLAFTFTRKAASEMRSRLLSSLEKAEKLSDKDLDALKPHAQLTAKLAKAVLNKNQEMQWHLLEDTRRLRITTIDSFNAYITSQLPLISSFGSQPEISEDIDPVFRQAVRETLSYLDDEHIISTALTELLQHLNNNLQLAENLLCQLLYKRDQWLPFVVDIRHNPKRAKEILESSLQNVINETLETAQSQLSLYSSDIMSLINFAAKQLATQGDVTLEQFGFTDSLPAPDPELVASWRALAGFFMLKSNDGFRKTVTVRNGFPKESDGKDPEEKNLFKSQKILFKELASALLDHPDLLPLFELLTRLPDPHYRVQQWQGLAALTTILPFLAAQLEVSLKQAGTVDFTQVSTAALAALGSEDKPTDLAMRLDYRIKHILVDEFQDTSSLQFRLLEKLTHDWHSGDGRTLFIVGDGMQSCYSFRNANVGLFLSARDRGIGSVQLESLQLKVNFRSEEGVVNWVNEVFQSAFPEQDNIGRGAVRYSPSTAQHNQDTEFQHSGVQSHFWVTDAQDSSQISNRQKRQTEAKEVAQCCQKLQQDHPSSSVAILVRNRSHLNEIVPALRHSGLSWNANDIDPLLSYSEINDLFSLLRALLNLADKTAWLALLRSPMMGFNLDDIHQLALHANDNKKSLWCALEQYQEINSLSEGACTRLNNTLPLLRNARALKQKTPLRELLENLWIALGGPATLLPDTDMNNIATFFDLVEKNQDNEEIRDIHAFQKKLDKLYASNSAQQKTQLQIMTIHNAKGLEFDFVLIPGLDRTPKADDNPLLVWKEHITANNNSELLLSLVRARGDSEDPLYEYLKYESKQRGLFESTRLLYIAITRAAKQAYLFGNIKRSKDQLSAAKGSLLSMIWPELQKPEMEKNVVLSDLTPETETNNQTNTGLAWPTQKIRKLPAHWQLPDTDLLALEMDITTDTIDALETPDPIYNNMLEKKIGDLLHFSLKLMVEKGPGYLQQPLLERIWRNRLLPICESEGELLQAINTLQLNIKNCMQHELSSWLFNSSHTDSACEYSISDYTWGYRQEYIIDRTFVDSEGCRWIIDYKSSRPSSGQSKEEFIVQQEERYRPQLENYARLIKAVNNSNSQIKLALFFTALPLWHPFEQ